MCNRITSVTNSFYSLSSYADAAFKTPYLPKNKKKKSLTKPFLTFAHNALTSINQSCQSQIINQRPPSLEIVTPQENITGFSLRVDTAGQF